MIVAPQRGELGYKFSNHYLNEDLGVQTSIENTQYQRNSNREAKWAKTLLKMTNNVAYGIWKEYDAPE
jgi:hypothetical protein